GVLDGPARLGQQRGVGTGDLAVADDLAERGDAELLGLGLGDHDRRRRTVGDLAGVAGRDVAGLVERGAQLGEGLAGGVAAHALVLADHDRVALALGHGDRDDLVVAQAVLGGGGRTLVALGRELVLGLALEAGGRGVLLGA